MEGLGTAAAGAENARTAGPALILQLLPQLRSHLHSVRQEALHLQSRPVESMRRLNRLLLGPGRSSAQRQCTATSLNIDMRHQNPKKDNKP